MKCSVHFGNESSIIFAALPWKKVRENKRPTPNCWNKSAKIVEFQEFFVKMWNILSRYLLFLLEEEEKVKQKSKFLLLQSTCIAYVLHFRQLWKLFSSCQIQRGIVEKLFENISRRFITLHIINVLCDALVMDTLTSKRKKKRENEATKKKMKIGPKRTFSVQNFYEKKALFVYVYKFIFRAKYLIMTCAFDTGSSCTHLSTIFFERL